MSGQELSTASGVGERRRCDAQVRPVLMGALATVSAATAVDSAFLQHLSVPLCAALLQVPPYHTLTATRHPLTATHSPTHTHPHPLTTPHVLRCTE